MLQSTVICLAFCWIILVVQASNHDQIELANYIDGDIRVLHCRRENAAEIGEIVIFFKDDVEFRPEPGNRITISNNRIRFDVTTLKLSDEGIYSCRLRNLRSHGVEFQVPPVIRNQVKDTYFEAENFSFPCGVFLGPLTQSFEYSVHWTRTIYYLDGTQSISPIFNPPIIQINDGLPESVTSNDQLHSFITSNSSLIVRNFSGLVPHEISYVNYTCEVMGQGFANKQSQTRVNLKVVGFSTKLPRVTVIRATPNEGATLESSTASSFTLSVVVTGSEVPQVEWFFNNSTIHGSEQFLIHNELTGRNALLSTLTVSSLREGGVITAQGSCCNSSTNTTTRVVILQKSLEEVSVESNSPCDATTERLTLGYLPDNIIQFNEIKRGHVNITLRLNLTTIQDRVLYSPERGTLSRLVDVPLNFTNFQKGTPGQILLDPQVLLNATTSGQRYRLQAKLSINGVENEDYSDYCNNERNVYPPLCESEVAQINKVFIDIFSSSGCSEHANNTVSDMLKSAFEALGVCADIKPTNYSCTDQDEGSSLILTVNISSYQGALIRSILQQSPSNLSIGPGFEVTDVQLPSDVVTTTPLTSAPYRPTNSITLPLTGGVTGPGSFILAVLCVIVILICCKRQRLRKRKISQDSHPPPTVVIAMTSPQRNGITTGEGVGGANNEQPPPYSPHPNATQPERILNDNHMTSNEYVHSPAITDPPPSYYSQGNSPSHHPIQHNNSQNHLESHFQPPDNRQPQCCHANQFYDPQGYSYHFDQPQQLPSHPHQYMHNQPLPDFPHHMQPTNRYVIQEQYTDRRPLGQRQRYRHRHRSDGTYGLSAPRHAAGCMIHMHGDTSGVAASDGRHCNNIAPNEQPRSGSSRGQGARSTACGYTSQNHGVTQIQVNPASEHCSRSSCDCQQVQDDRDEQSRTPTNCRRSSSNHQDDERRRTHTNLTDNLCTRNRPQDLPFSRGSWNASASPANVSRQCGEGLSPGSRSRRHSSGEDRLPRRAEHPDDVTTNSTAFKEGYNQGDSYTSQTNQYETENDPNKSNSEPPSKSHGLLHSTDDVIDMHDSTDETDSRYDNITQVGQSGASVEHLPSASHESDKIADKLSDIMPNPRLIISANDLDLSVKTFDSEGGLYYNQDHDITLKVPADAIPKNLTVQIEIRVPFMNWFGSYQPVSAIIELCVVNNPRFRFLKPLEITIPHFLDLDDNNLTTLRPCFLKAAHGTTDFMHVVDGEQKFESHNCYGILYTDHFCHFCIAAKRSVLANSSTRYSLVRITPKEICKPTWKIFYCVIYSLPTCFKAVKEQFNRLHSDDGPLEYVRDEFKFSDESFEESNIEISFEQEQNGGWTINQDCCRTQIFASDVDFSELTDLEERHNEGMYPPRFTLTVYGSKASQDSCASIGFKGTTPRLLSKVMLLLLLQASEPSKKVSSMRVLKDVDVHGGPKLEDLMNEVAAKIPTKWRDIGIQLGLKVCQLEEIGQTHYNDTNACFSKVFQKWQSLHASPYSWSTIIGVLETPSVEEIQLAASLKEFLVKQFMPYS